MSEEKRAQGQDGDPLALFLDEMNKDERAIVGFVEKKLVASMEELTKLLGGAKRCADDPSRPVRNALRRLCRGKVLRRDDRGIYEKGKRFDVAIDPFARAKAILPRQTPRTTVDMGALVLAALDSGGSDSYVAKTIEQSRGYVIPRVKRLREAKLLKATHLRKAGPLLEAIAWAEAGK